MKVLILVEDIGAPETWERVEIDGLYMDYIMQRFPDPIPNAKFYHGTPSEATDITPTNESELELIEAQECVIYVLWPTGIVAAIVAVVAVVVGVAVAYFMAPSVPTSTQKNTVQQSPNNELTGRTNKPRPNARIPDPFGTVRVTPDTVAVPFNIFVNHQEVEHSFMVIGRGEYDIQKHNVFDHTSLFNEVLGASLEVYAPYTSPNSGHVPQLRIGDPINRKIETVYKNNGVNGQTLRPPNASDFKGNGTIRFVAPNIIQLKEMSGDFTTKFSANDTVTISGANAATGYSGQYRTVTAHNSGDFTFPIPSNALPAEFVNSQSLRLEEAVFNVTNESGQVVDTYNLSGTYQIANLTQYVVGTQNYVRIVLLSAASVNPDWLKANGVTTSLSKVLAEGNNARLNLDGQYRITSVSTNVITLSNPAAINSNWNYVSTTEWTSASLSVSGPKWIGPFTLNDPNTTGMYLNFVASNGLFADDGSYQWAQSVWLEVEIQPVSPQGVPTGGVQLHQVWVIGSDTERSQRAVTLRLENLWPSNYKVRVRRVSDTNTNFQGSVVDEVKWRDMYSTSDTHLRDFGDVTCVQVVNFATTGALTMKERKVNMIVTRKVNSVDSNYNLLPYKIASNKASDILLHTSLDKFIGRRNIQELDVQGIYKTISEVENYFGTPLATEFCYTFDKTNLSYENTAAMIANAVFCEVYRQASLIGLFFERKTNDTVLLFNHRNKLPDTEKRQFRFGVADDNNGVVYSYTDAANDDTIATIVQSNEPNNQEPNNAKSVEGVGVRNRLQAYFHAKRLWSKMQYQNLSCTFDATEEGSLLIKGNRILNTNGTRSFTQEGYVKKQEVLALTLSQPVDPKQGKDYVICLQLPDATVQNIDILFTSNNRQVILTKPTTIPLDIDAMAYNDCKYVIYEKDTVDPDAFLVASRKTNDNLTASIECYNYNAIYYEGDKHFINGVVDINGFPK